MASKAPSGFPKTGKARPPQFKAPKGGATETGFIQKTPKAATAAMMGRAMPSGSAGKNTAKPKNGGKKQFGTPKGKKPF